MEIKHDKDNIDYEPRHASLSRNNKLENIIYQENEIAVKNDYQEEVKKDEEIYKKREQKIKKKKKKRRIKKWVLNLLIVIFLVIMGVSFYKIFIWEKDNQDVSKMVDEINKNVEILEIEDNDDTEIIGEPEEDVVSDYWYYIKFPLINVDIDSLKQKNSDTVGWINVNNTNINYPFVQRNDNDFYLDHSFDKSYNEAGWVFMDYRNNVSLDNKNTILYAHSRLDKTMFGSLSKTLKSDWYKNKDNHIIRISTDKDNTLWQIFSVYKIEEESYYITTNFGSDLEYSKFLDTIKGRSIYNFSTNLSINDKILTLSTCYSETERTVVHAKLIKRNIKE